MPIFWISFSSQNSVIGNVGKSHTHTHPCHSPVCMFCILRCRVKLFGHVMPAPCFLYSVAIPLFCRRKLIYLSSDILVEYVLMMTTTYLTKTILRTLEDCTICTTVLLLTSKMHKEMNSSLYANTWCAIHMQIQVHTHFHTHTKCTHSLSQIHYQLHTGITQIHFWDFACCSYCLPSFSHLHYFFRAVMRHTG